MDKTELVASLRQRLFADRGTDVAAAFDYCNMLIDSIPGGNEKIAARTALHVLANTVANAIEALPDPLAAPPAEVRIAPDNPAAGITDLESVIIRLIDARIAQSPSLGDRIDHLVDRAIDTRAITEVIDQVVEGKVTEGIDDFIENQLDDAVQKCIDNSVDWTEIVRDELRNNITFSIEVD